MHGALFHALIASFLKHINDSFEPSVYIQGTVSDPQTNIIQYNNSSPRQKYVTYMNIANRQGIVVLGVSVRFVTLTWMRARVRSSARTLLLLDQEKRGRDQKSSSRKNDKAFRLVKLVDISSRKNEASSSKAVLLLCLLFSPSKAGFGKEMTSTRLRTFDFIRMWGHLQILSVLNV